MRVAVFGLGYVGTVSAACLARDGHQIVGVDPDATKVDLINEGVSPVVEPGLSELVNEMVTAGSLTATTDPATALAGADVAFLCVATPSAADGSADLRFIERVSTQIGEVLATLDHTIHVVVRSTVPPGTASDVVAPALAAASGKALNHGFGVAMCPEFLREGTSLDDFRDPPFTVIGAEHADTIEALRSLFSAIDRPVHVVSIRTAEALKYSCNAFHALKVSFTNELARLFRAMEVDSREVMALFVEDDRLNVSKAYLRPGFAFGGSCLPKDVRSLQSMARTHSIELPVLNGTMAVNRILIEETVKRVQASGSRTVAMLGVSFKAQTDDLRESPYVELVERLLGKGFDVRIYDPIINPTKLFGANLRYVTDHLPHLQRLLVTDVRDALNGAETVIVANTPADAIEQVVSANPSLVLDLNGRFGEKLEALEGYQGVGW
jgi:GDP-mannose 6-dehydrogenase